MEQLQLAKSHMWLNICAFPHIRKPFLIYCTYDFATALQFCWKAPKIFWFAETWPRYPEPTPTQHPPALPHQHGEQSGGEYTSSLHQLIPDHNFNSIHSLLFAFIFSNCERKGNWAIIMFSFALKVSTSYNIVTFTTFPPVFALHPDSTFPGLFVTQKYFF